MSYIYVLELAENKYYIGKTDNLNYDYNTERNEWSTLYKPRRLIGIFSNTDINEIVLKYMEKYGINNVRGGSYDSLELDRETINNIKQILGIDEPQKKIICYKCNEEGHYANQCIVCYKCGESGHYANDCEF